MSVMLRCACGNQFAASGATGGKVECPACHAMVDSKDPATHVEDDDLELSLAPDDDFRPATPKPTAAPAAAPQANQPAASKDSGDDLLSWVDTSDAAADDDDLGLLADDLTPASTSEPAASFLATPTPDISPPEDDEEGYAIVEEESYAASTPSWLSETSDAPTSDADDIPLMEDEPAKPAAKQSTSKPDGAKKPAEQKAAKSAASESGEGVQPSAMDDLLDDEIKLAVEEKPAAIVDLGPPTQCPECKAEMKAGAVLCLACGFNTKLGKKMDGAPAPKGKAKAKAKDKSSAPKTAIDWKAKLKDPRVMIGAGGGGLVLLLALIGYLFFGGSEKKPAPAPAVANNPVTQPGAASGGPTPPTPPVSTSSSNSSASSSSSSADGESKPRLLIAPTGITGRISSIAFSADGKLIAAGDESGAAQVWEIESGTAKPALRTGVTSPVQVSFDAEGKQLVTGFSGGAKLWKLEDGSEARSFKSPVDGQWAARFSGDGKSLITSGPTGAISVVDLGSGGKTKSAKVDLPPGVAPVVDLTADGKTGIVGADDGLLLVWDVVGAKPLKLLEGHTTRIGAVAISGDGKHAISAAGGPEYHLVGKERLLASSRPTDFTVRLWDVATGRETYRLRTSPTSPITAVGFSDDGKYAVVVAGDVRVIDVATKELIATLSPAPTGTAPSTEPGVPNMPIEPFRLATFSADGKRLLTIAGSSGMHLWQLPDKPEAKPLGGIADPPSLAKFSPSAWTPIPPLVLKESAVPDDRATVERLALSAKAAKASGEKNPTIKKFQKALAGQPHTVENLLKLAKSCQKGKLELEAEECLRAVLMADPQNAEAKKLYEELKVAGAGGAGPVAVARAWPKEVLNLEDAGQHPEPPKGMTIVSIPIEVSIVDKLTKLDPTTITGKAGENEATFYGIHQRPTGEIKGARKGGPSLTGQAQVWEVMSVANSKSGKKIVQLQNRRQPQAEPVRGKPPGGGSNAPKVKMQPDKTSAQEDYKGPYEALFAVPEGEMLSEIQFGETPAIRLLSEEPKSLDKLAVDSKTGKTERIAAIEAIGVAPTPTSDETLEKVMATGDDELFAAARAAMRAVRRKANLIAPEYVPVPSEKDAHLAALVLGKIDGQGIQPPSTPQFVPSGPTVTPIPVNNSYTFCKALWNLDKAGKYQGRVALFGPAPNYDKLTALQFEFEAEGPNLYATQVKTDRDLSTATVQLTELWLDGKLVERRILSENPLAASTVAARTPLQPPRKAKVAEDEEEDVRPGREGLPPGLPPSAVGGGGGGLGTATDLFTGDPLPVQAAPLFGSTAKLLPPVERGAIEELIARVPESEQGKIPTAIVEVARLEMGNAALTADALAALLASLGDAAAPVFIRLADESSAPTNLSAIEALRTLGEKSPEACRKLIDLQKGPADMQKAAEAAVNDLMTQGVIAQEGENWRYHKQTHFPEKKKDGDKPSDATDSEPDA